MAGKRFRGRRRGVTSPGMAYIFPILLGCQSQIVRTYKPKVLRSGLGESQLPMIIISGGGV